MKIRFFNRIALVGTLAVAVLFLAACAVAPAPAAAPQVQTVEVEKVVTKEVVKEVPAELPEKLVFWHMYFDDDADKGRVIKDFASAFEASTGIKVELSQIVWTDHIKRMGVVGAAEDKTPDVFVSGLAAPGLQGMVAGGYVLPLDDYVTPDILSQYSQPLLEQARVDGKLYGFPQESQVFGLVYNQQVLDELGIEPPTTLEELEAAMDAMLEADILPMPIVLGSGSFASAWLFQELAARAATQAEMDAVTDGTAKFSDTFMVVLETMERWADKGYFGPNVLSNEWEQMSTLQLQGKVGLMPMGGFWPAGAKAEAGVDDLDYGILVPPPLVEGIPKQVAGGLWWAISVNSRSEYPEWSARLAEALSGKGFSEQWVRRTFNLAAGEVDKEQITFTPLKEYLDILEDHATVWFNVPAEINSDYENVLSEVVAGQTTAADAAERIDALFASVSN